MTHDVMPQSPARAQSIREISADDPLTTNDIGKFAVTADGQFVQIIAYTEGDPDRVLRRLSGPDGGIGKWEDDGHVLLEGMPDPEWNLGLIYKPASEAREVALDRQQTQPAAVVTFWIEPEADSFLFTFVHEDGNKSTFRVPARMEPEIRHALTVHARTWARGE